MCKYPSLLAMKNKKNMDVFLSLTLKISSCNCSPSIFQDEIVKNVSSKKKLKECQFFSCNKAAVAQASSVTVQRHGGKTNTNEILNSRTEDTEGSF